MKNPVITRFIARLPPSLAATFTADQLAAVELHFAMRHATRHTIDWRFRLPFLHYYFVLLAGHDHRGNEA